MILGICQPEKSADPKIRLAPMRNKADFIIIRGVSDGTRTHDIQNHNLTL